MSTAPPGFEKALDVYLKSLERPNSEAGRAYLFLEFSRGVFKQIDTDYLEKLFPVLEKHLTAKAKTLVVKGRIDAFLGNLIIEFKKVLDRNSLEEAESELRRYVSILWTQQKGHRVSYIVIATDGIKFVSFRPRTAVEENEVTPEEVFLDEIDKIDLTQTKPGAAFVWLDRYMLTATLRPATAEAFSNEFGLGKPAFDDAEAFLKQAWKSSEESVLYDQWAGFLRIVYGTDVHSQDLFIRHTYLATLAKLLAYSSFSGGALPVSPNQITEILEGRVFEKWNIHNFLEEDFFSWIARTDQGVKAASALLERLASYDLSIIDEDILKALYQELVDPQARHDLGEYYTPDWLAELMVEKVQDDATQRVLDPACGSGTFLAASIRHKKELMKRKKPREQLEILLNTVVGVDVHPLAVILSRTNFLTAIGTNVLSARRGPISIPVYLADSIRLPELNITLFDGVSVFTIKAEKRILRLPLDIAKEPVLTDRIVEIVKEYAKSIAEGQKADFTDFENLLTERIEASWLTNLESESIRVLFETAKTLAQLIEEGRDTVWAFILKNIYRPLFLKDKKFDVVIGNPPWLSYRYVESTDYQNFLKGLILKSYRLLGSEKTELITQMELATLFLYRSCDLYLTDDGTISFVMPRSIFIGDQHHNFRKGLASPTVEIMQVFDLEDVSPLFRVPSCVITARSGTNRYPIKAVMLKGELPQKNCKLAEARDSLVQTEGKFDYFEIGQRSFLESPDFAKVLKAIDLGKRSNYYDDFSQGATIVPHSLWFVEPVVHPQLGIDPTKPRLKTSEIATTMAKDAYKDVVLEGEVESRFLYQVVTGSELGPFCTKTLQVAVLPIEPYSGHYHIVKADEARQKGLSGLKNWLTTAEETWRRKRGEKADKLDIYQRLDYSRGLTNQSSRARYRVLYNKDGKYLVACVAEGRHVSLKADSSNIRLSGVVADDTTLHFDTDDLDEAMFVAGLLNSPIIDALIKPMQSRGQWGERHIQKKVLELPLPRYEPKNGDHAELVRLAKGAQVKAQILMANLESRYSGIGKIRQLIKVEINEELLKIDKITKVLLFEAGSVTSGLDDFVRRE